MLRIFDYRCGECPWRGEILRRPPAPLTDQCPQCASEARRVYSIAGILRTGESLASIAPASGSTDCVDNPDVPGLCHVKPTARRAMIARHRGDDFTFAREQKRQKREFEQFGAPKLSDVVETHAH